jgi:hypothetical protein
VSWRQLESAAPELARAGRERFERTRVVLLGTVRADGSPRISPVEPYFILGELVLGVMASPKARDLRRDPRLVVHSSVSEIDGSEGEFKVHGRAIATDDTRFLKHEGAWWVFRAADRFTVYRVDVDEAILIEWSSGQESMRTSRWTPAGGTRDTTRTYP